MVSLRDNSADLAALTTRSRACRPGSLAFAKPWQTVQIQKKRTDEGGRPAQAAGFVCSPLKRAAYRERGQAGTVLTFAMAEPIALPTRHPDQWLIDFSFNPISKPALPKTAPRKRKEEFAL